MHCKNGVRGVLRAIDYSFSWKIVKPHLVFQPEVIAHESAASASSLSLAAGQLADAAGSSFGSGSGSGVRVQLSNGTPTGENSDSAREEQAARVPDERFLDVSGVFSIEPQVGLLSANGILEFSITFAPLEVRKLLDPSLIVDLSRRAASGAHEMYGYLWLCRCKTT